MQIVVSEDGSPRLQRAEHFNEFEVLLGEAQARLPDVLTPDGAHHVWVDEAWLRSALARARPVPDWEQKYGAMLAYARSKGWTREPPLSLRAHIARTGN